MVIPIRRPGPAGGTGLAGRTGPAAHTGPAGGTLSLRTLVATHLVALRRARGWTQAQLARRARIDRSVVSRIERARSNITVATLERLARALDCSEADLVRRLRPRARGHSPGN